MNNLSIGQKVYIPLIASIVIGFVAVLINYWLSVDQLQKGVYETQAKEMKTVFDEAIESKKSVGLTNSI